MITAIALRSKETKAVQVWGVQTEAFWNVGYMQDTSINSLGKKKYILNSNHLSFFFQENLEAPEYTDSTKSLKNPKKYNQENQQYKTSSAM